MPNAPQRLLGEGTAGTFLRRHWQKRALLVRDALPGFVGPMTRAALMTLAARDDVESRLVVRERGRWSLSQGPFRRIDFRHLPSRGWTLLVQGVNLHVRECDDLLRRFSFIPYARLDDLMVSYAAPGGGVGPHCDSYDVFLLQGFGQRRWRYGTQRDLSLLPNRPLKILKRFEPKHDAVLRPGDMLYLPPRQAHDGIAIDECTTYSIGFRAPFVQEIVNGFLDFLRDDLELDGYYTDADLAPAAEPARIDAATRRRMGKHLARIRWDERTVARFVGCFLTEPKPTVFFEPPAAPLTGPAFGRRIASRGIVLDLRSQLLYDDASLYINGDAFARPAGGEVCERLANDRALAADRCARPTRDVASLLYQWYRNGYLHPAG